MADGRAGVLSSPCRYCGRNLVNPVDFALRGQLPPKAEIIYKIYQISRWPQAEQAYYHLLAAIAAEIS